MEISLVEVTKTDVGDSEISQWFIDINDGETVIDLEKSTSLSILECAWIDSEKTFIDVFHSEYDGGEYHAIVNTSGNVIRKGLKEIRQYIKSEHLFIVELEIFALSDDELAKFDLNYEDYKVAVINKFGEIIIPQFFDNIIYDEDFGQFEVSPNVNFKNGFSIEGLRL